MSEEETNGRVNALIPFSDAQSGSLVSVSRQIRDCIRTGLATDDNKLWDSLEPLLIAEGTSGGRVWDHAMVGFQLLAKIPALKMFKNLTIHSVYDHFTAVVVQQGFLMRGGYIVGHSSDDIEFDNVEDSIVIKEAV